MLRMASERYTIPNLYIFRLCKNSQSSLNTLVQTRQDHQVPQDLKDIHDPQDLKDIQYPQDLKVIQDPQDHQDPQDLKDIQDPQAFQDPQVISYKVALYSKV